MLLETKVFSVSARNSRELDETMIKFLANNKWIQYILITSRNLIYEISFGILSNKPELDIKTQLSNKSKILQFKPVNPIKEVDVRWFKYISSPYPETTTIIMQDNVYFIYESDRKIGQDIVDSKFINPKLEVYG